MTTLTASKAREQLSEALNQVAYGGDRIVIKRRGKVLAVLVSEKDLALLEAIEERMDVEEAERRLAEAKRKGHKPIPWEQAKKRLALLEAIKDRMDVEEAERRLADPKGGFLPYEQAREEIGLSRPKSPVGRKAAKRKTRSKRLAK